jgi:hypothetical protein
MSWLYTHRRTWRTVGLVALLIALAGPWAFDRIYVPMPYECTPPHVRLNDDFCGIPISIATYLPSIIQDFPGIVARFMAGEIRLLEAGFFLFLFFIILPLFSSLFTISWTEHRGWQIAHLAVLGLADAAVLWMVGLNLMTLPGESGSTNTLPGLMSFARTLLALWGMWLYFMVIECLVLFEVLTLIRGRKPAAE